MYKEAGLIRDWIVQDVRRIVCMQSLHRSVATVSTNLNATAEFCISIASILKSLNNKIGKPSPETTTIIQNHQIMQRAIFNAMSEIIHDSHESEQYNSSIVILAEGSPLIEQLLDSRAGFHNTHVSLTDLFILLANNLAETKLIIITPDKWTLGQVTAIGKMTDAFGKEYPERLKAMAANYTKLAQYYTDCLKPADH